MQVHHPAPVVFFQIFQFFWKRAVVSGTLEDSSSLSGTSGISFMSRFYSDLRAQVIGHRVRHFSLAADQLRFTASRFTMQGWLSHRLRQRAPISTDIKAPSALTDSSPSSGATRCWRSIFYKNILEHLVYLPSVAQLNDPTDCRPKIRPLSEEEMVTFLRNDYTRTEDSHEHSYSRSRLVPTRTVED